MPLQSPVSSYNTTQDTSQNMDMDLFKARCTVHIRGQIDTNCTWSQHQLLCGQILQIAELIECLYNKHTSFTFCSVSGIKMELESPFPSLLQPSPEPANTFPPSNTTSLAHPTNLRGQMETPWLQTWPPYLILFFPHSTIIIYLSRCVSPLCCLPCCLYLFLSLPLSLSPSANLYLTRQVHGLLENYNYAL